MYHNSKPLWMQNLPRKIYKRRTLINNTWLLTWLFGFGYLFGLAFLDWFNNF